VRVETLPKSTGTAAGASAENPTIAEMRQRHIVPQDAVRWTPDQYAGLLRMREAEAMGAFDLLRDKLGTLRGYAAESPRRQGYRSLWLTEEGYDKFIFLLSQDALAYFQSRGAEVKFVFKLKGVNGKRLFDGGTGLLTQDGVELYNRVRRKLPAFWRYPDGTVNGNVRPPKELGPTAVALPPAPAERPLKPGDDAKALQKVVTLMQSGYVEITQAEVQGLTGETKLSEADLRRQSSLQIIVTKAKTYYLLSPSDPLTAIVARSRAAAAQ
jgi:hypothetical protein